MTPDIPTLTDLFGEPAAIIVAAFAIASTEPLKTGISALASILSLLWLICDLFAMMPGDTPQSRMLIALPAIFFVCSVVCFCVHGWRWLQAGNNAQRSSSDLSGTQISKNSSDGPLAV